MELESSSEVLPMEFIGFFFFLTCVWRISNSSYVNGLEFSGGTDSGTGKKPGGWRIGCLTGGWFSSNHVVRDAMSEPPEMSYFQADKKP